MRIFLLLILIVLFQAIFMVSVAQARITPEDIVNSKREAYQKAVEGYTFENKRKLEEISFKISQLNKQKTDELSQFMEIQGRILDEYDFRTKGRNEKAVENARYWITFAHEAVAYQAAKIYIFNLTSENNLNSDVFSTINLFRSDLNSTRQKVINSQNTLKGVIK